MDNVPTIGLFGTCGSSTWRRRFIDLYRDAGVRYFNPQVENWSPELADIEAGHLLRDEIILFPVTDETYGGGSLAETGYSILQAISKSAFRWVIMMIAPEPAEHLKADEVAFKESVRARRLVQAHLAANPYHNVYVVDDLDEMLALSLELHGVAHSLKVIERRRAAG